MNVFDNVETGDGDDERGNDDDERKVGNLDLMSATAERPITDLDVDNESTGR